MTATARKLADEKYGTKDLKDLSEFMIPLSNAINMMEEYAKLKVKEENATWNDGYNRGCEDTHAAYKDNV